MGHAPLTIALDSSIGSTSKSLAATTFETHDFEYSPLYVAVSAARAYAARELCWSQLWDAVEQAADEIALCLDEADEHGVEVPMAARAILLESLQRLEDFLETQPTPNSVDNLLTKLESWHSEFVKIETGDFYRALAARRAQARLEDILEQAEIAEWELELGDYSEITAALSEQVSQNEVLDLLEEQYELVERQIQAHDDSYLAKEEWTVEVELGDELLVQGLYDWIEGLHLLFDSIRKGKCWSTLSRGLSWLKEGNRKFILVERLQVSLCP